MVIQSEELVKAPVVSVVIATYNHADFINETVESALAQETTFPYEIVIGDDGSTDGTRDILKQFQLEHPDCIKLVFNDSNLWVTKNYINAIKEARGTFISTFDGDDIMLPTKLQKQYVAITSMTNVSIVNVGFLNFESKTHRTTSVCLNWESPLLTEKDKNTRVYDYLTYQFPFFPISSTVLFRRDQFLSGCENFAALIDDPNSTGEETLINVLMCLNGNFHFINEILLHRRIQDNSITSFDSDEKAVSFYLKRVFHLYNAAAMAGLGVKQKNKIIKLSLDKVFDIAIRGKCIRYFKKEVQKKNNLYESPLIPDSILSKYTCSVCVLMNLILFFPIREIKRRFHKIRKS